MDRNLFHDQQSSMANYFQPTSTYSFMTNDFHPTSHSTSQRNMIIMPTAPTIDPSNQATQVTTQVWQSDELGLFYKPQNDDNFYHVICKMILQDFISLDD